MLHCSFWVAPPHNSKCGSDAGWVARDSAMAAGEID
jgi:hypothetical protein